MTWLLLLGLFIACMSLTIWGFKKKENFYQYPFLIGIFFLILLMPQAASLCIHRADQMSDDTLNRILMMSVLCLIASFLGYKVPIPKKYLLRLPFSMNSEKLLAISKIYVVAGTLISLFISDNIGYEISGTSTGLFTVLIFFLRGFLYLGMPIVITYSLKNFTLQNFLFSAAALLIPFYQALFLGRRSSLFILIFSILLSIFFVKKILIGRYLVLIGLIFALIINTNIVAYRDYLTTGDVETLRKYDFVNETFTYFDKPKRSLELRNAAFLADYSDSHFAYGFGSFYWDRLVFSFVPAQFLGEDLKSSLQINATPGRDELLETYGYEIPFGTTNTGIGEAFTQFDYAGCLLFAAHGWLCKLVWNRVFFWNSPFLLAVYLNLIQSSTVGVLISGSSIMLVRVINIFIFSIPIIFYAADDKYNKLYHCNHF